ncbi:DNA invertase [Sulfitobacter sp. JL08]|nr:DNA invertase [Sulfitobacter sp. JL08]
MEQYVVYKRVSTKGQGESGLGLEAQQRDIGLYLENYAPKEHKVIDTFTDVLSGASSDRPQLNKAIKMAKENNAILLIAKLDRLSRKVSFIATLMDDPKLMLRVAVMPNADKFQLHIYAALAEQEREFISTRTKAALKEAKARGVKLGGYREGTKKRHKALQVEALKRAQHVYPTIKAYRDSGLTLQQTADEMNRIGLKTARGGQWYPSTVRGVVDRVLDNA